MNVRVRAEMCRIADEGMSFAASAISAAYYAYHQDHTYSVRHSSTISAS